MRSSLTFGSVALLALLAACGTDPAVGDDDGNGSGSGSGSGSDVDPEPPARGFQMKSPEITIKAGQEITYCWYFKTPNTEAYTIKRWASHMSDGSHHMIVFFTNSLSQPEGTVSSSSCGFGGGSTSNIGQWIYAAQTVDADMPMPADDGAGKPVGMDVNPGQAGFIQMHYLNSTDADMTVHVTLNAEAYEAGVTATKTFAFVTFSPDINIGPMAMGVTNTHTCPIPATSKVWLMSTHAHKQAVHTEVRDGAAASTNVVFASNSWEHPVPQKWMTNPFYTFASGKLTYECRYDNPTSNTIKTGDSAQTDEMCMATGYVFPATKATICYGNNILPF